MIDILELRDAINTHLKSLTSNGVYFIKAPITATYPYLVYSFQTIVDGYSENIIELTLDFWDDEYDTNILENFVKTVNAGTDRGLINNDNLSMTLFLDNQLALDDSETEINRRQNTYSAHYYSKI